MHEIEFTIPVGQFSKEFFFIECFLKIRVHSLCGVQRSESFIKGCMGQALQGI
jgi:hypothetical protein